MATLYFAGLGVGGNGDWSITGNWYLAVSPSGVFSSPAGRIPISTDTVVIYGVVNTVSSVYENPAVLQIGSNTNYVYFGFWDGDNFDLANPVTFNVPLVNIKIGTFWASASINISYNMNTMNVYGSSAFEGNATIGTSNFYNVSTNGGSDISGNIIGNVNFYNNSTNGGGSNGYITGNVNFYNNSSNCNDSDANNGFITGNVTFNDSSRNASGGTIGHVKGDATFNDNSTDAVDGYVGIVVGTAIFTSNASVSVTLAGVIVDASIVLNLPSGGISRSNVLLTELLKLPFPIIL